MIRFLPKRDDEQQQRVMSSYMVDGKLTNAKNIPGKNLYKQLNAHGKAFSRIENAINDFLNGMLITENTEMVDDWERCLKIPDGVFVGDNTLEERRRACVFKLSSEGMATKEELEWLLSTYGIVATVYPGMHFYNNYDPRVGTFSSEKEARFTIVFGVDLLASEPEVSQGQFPITFPWYFSQSRTSAAIGFMREVIQANVNARWFFDGDIIQDVIEHDDIWQDTTDSTDIIQDV